MYACSYGMLFFYCLVVVLGIVMGFYVDFFLVWCQNSKEASCFGGLVEWIRIILSAYSRYSMDDRRSLCFEFWCVVVESWMDWIVRP